jgi:multiple sugar transport system substrate-binding protein
MATARTNVSRRAVLRGAAGGGALALAACGAAQGGTQPAAKDAGPPKRVTFVKTQATETKDNGWRDTFKLAEKAINVIPELVTEPADGFFDKRVAEYAAGTANYDITTEALNQFLILGLKGGLVDLLPLFKKDKFDTNQYYKADFESWMWKGKLYALTFQAGGECVMYNKALFQAKGVKLPTKDWTYDDFLQACQRLNDPSNGFYAVHVQQNTVQYMFGTFMRNFGGTIVNDARDKAVYADDAKSIQGAELNVDLHQKYKVAWTAADVAAQFKGTSPMREKRAAMEINGNTSAIEIYTAIGKDLDYAPPPKGPTGVQMARVAGNAWSILKLSKNQDAAWSVLKWLHTKEGLLGPQLVALAWPPTIWAADSPPWQDQPHIKGTHIADATDVWRKAGHNEVVLPEGDNALQLMNMPVTQALAGTVATREGCGRGRIASTPSSPSDRRNGSRPDNG